MPSLVVPTVQQGMEWKEIRLALHNCIKLISPTSVVYPSWPLKYDIKKTVRLLESEAYNNLVHAWMIKVSGAKPYNPKAGGYPLDWDLDVSIWGFVGYAQTHDDDTQNLIEAEVRTLSQVIHFNQKHLGMANTAGLKEVGELVWDDIDVHAFGSGSDVHVAQGKMKITLSETFILPLS